VTVGSNVAFGVYDLAVQGSSGAIKNTGALQLTVKAFTLSLSTPVIALKGDDNQNKSGDVTVTINRSPGFNDSVQLALEGIPVGGSPGTALSASINPQATAGNTAVIHVSVGRLAPEGGYALTVRGTSGNLVDTAQLTVDVIASDVSSPIEPFQP
jgi:hypothetical protein